MRGNNKNHTGGRSKGSKGGQTRTTELIARGAATVAVTAGVVAAGAMLADKRNREKIGKGIEKMKSVTGEVMDKTQKAYPQAVSHMVRMNRTSSKTEHKRGRGAHKRGPRKGEEQKQQHEERGSNAH